MSTKPKTRKPPSKPLTRMAHTVPVRVSLAEYLILKAMARAWTGGNVSEWLRHASLNFKPRPPRACANE